MKKIIVFLILSTILAIAKAEDNVDVLRFQIAYPEHIIGQQNDSLIWSDGTVMPLHEGKPNKTTQEKLEAPALIDQLSQAHYLPGQPADPSMFNPAEDPGRIRYEPFFRKMYGNSEEEVKQKLVLIYWMPKIFGDKYPLLITTVNNVSMKLKHVSEELEVLVALHPEYRAFLENPGGTFKWRVIANTTRLSPHSFGMTIDINAELANYWQWDLAKAGKEITEDAEFTYQNNVPWEIVLIFEKYGFVWGGKWRHYDTMHFEYRPELMIS